MPIIISGGSYSAGGWWSNHLQKAETNERVEIAGFSNLSAESIPDAFREMEAFAAGTRCKNYFYQANINPRADEHLTPAQWQEAVDRLEKNLGLTGQPRFVVEHEKEGRTHRHVVWSRIDTEKMRAISDSLTAAIHERTSRELEIRFDLERGQSVLVPNRERERPERRPKKSETFRTERGGIDPATVKADGRAAWERADNGQSFKAALETSGDYVLARGDRRDFVIIDRTGDDHSLARRLGIKAADVRARMADIDSASLPSVAEAKAQQQTRHVAQERQQQPEPQPGMQNTPAAAHGPYSELRAAQTASQFTTAANRVTEPAAPVFDRDAADAAWQATIESAAIAAQEARQKPQRVPEAQKDQKDRPAAEGRYDALQTPQPAPDLKPERELTGTGAEIRTAWATSRTATELEDALAARGISLARVSAEEAYASERRAALAKEAGNFAPVWREGEIVAVDGRGSAHRLTERTTGDERGEIEGRLAGIDRAALMNVADTQEVMRAASLAAWKDERRAEREQARPASAIETTVADALTSTMTGTDFAAALDEKGLTIARVTAADVLALDALREADRAAGTYDEQASGRRFAEIKTGELAAVTRQGDVFRVSPQKLDFDEIEQRLADVQTRLPSVVEARALNEIEGERKAEQRTQSEADFIASRLEQADAFAGKQELRQATRAAETVVHAAFETPVAAADKALDVASGFLGGAVKIVAEIGNFLGGLFGGPKDTKAQAEQKAKAATNEETLHARDYAATVQANEAEFDDRMHAQKTSQQEQDLSFAARFGTPPTREANIGREHDNERERERER